MITVNVNIDRDGAHRDGLPLEGISEVVTDRERLLWLDVVAPEPHELALLAAEFGFHPLAVEDAAKRHQRPKIDLYDGYVFLVFYELTLLEERPHLHEFSCFVGPNYLISIHEHPAPFVAEIAGRWCAHAETLRRRGVAFLVYGLLDALVDAYFPVVDTLADRIERLETQIFERGDPAAQREIFAFRKDLTTIRHILGPERDVLNVLVRRDSPILGDETTIYFQDVYDHILRVTDSIDTYRDLLASALDAALSVTSNRLNRVMKTLTASSIILMSMTLVAGIYGMNFAHMPELDWSLGYLWALGLMAGVGLVLAGIFQRIDWL